MLWGRATEGERLQVVEAFGANTRVLQVEMANAHANDALAAAWARSLSTNNSLTSLNLESNSIGAGGIEALAEALLENRALTELKLANQRVACSQRAEESLAATAAMTMAPPPSGCTLVTWNLLAPHYASASKYPWSKAEELAWPARQAKIVEHLADQLLAIELPAETRAYLLDEYTARRTAVKVTGKRFKDRRNEEQLLCSFAHLILSLPEAQLN